MKIDLKIGDVVLSGKFKNKANVVKSFGKDEHGQPTIVNEKGKVIKLLAVRIKKLMKEQQAYDNGNFFGKKGAGIIFYCETTNRILLGLRSEMVNEPNTWNGIGGRVEDDENPKEAAKREVREEAFIGGSYSNLELFYIFKSNNFSYYNYLVKVKKEFNPKPSDEMSKFNWFDLNNLPKKLHFGFKASFKNLIKKINEN